MANTSSGPVGRLSFNRVRLVRHLDIFLIGWCTLIDLIADVPEWSDAPFVDIQALAAVLDSALKAHEGTISEVPTAGFDPNWSFPFFDEFCDTKTVKMSFQYGIHHIKEYRLIQDEKACVVKSDDTSMYGDNGNAGGRFRSGLKISFLDVPVPVTIAFLMAHKSSLWPDRLELPLVDEVISV